VSISPLNAPDCDAIRPLVSLYVDDEVTVAEASLVEAHTASCARCASDLAFFRAAHAVLSRPAEALPPAALRERVAAATFDRLTLGARLRRALRPTPSRLAVVGSAVAAGLVMVAVVSREPQPPSGLVVPRVASSDPSPRGGEVPGTVPADPTTSAPAPSVRTAVPSGRATSATAAVTVAPPRVKPEARIAGVAAPDREPRKRDTVVALENRAASPRNLESGVTGKAAAAAPVGKAPAVRDVRVAVEPGNGAGPVGRPAAVKVDRNPRAIQNIASAGAARRPVVPSVSDERPAPERDALDRDPAAAAVSPPGEPEPHGPVVAAATASEAAVGATGADGRIRLTSRRPAFTEVALRTDGGGRGEGSRFRSDDYQFGVGPAARASVVDAPVSGLAR
jgi:hypothetical protein